MHNDLISKYGFFRTAAAVPCTAVANCRKNADKIIGMSAEAHSKGVSLIAFPELSVTGYTCADLFHQTLLIEDAVRETERICRETAELDIIILAGIPVRHNEALYNCAAVMHKGRVMGIVPKSYVPNYGEFYEGRWFASGKNISSVVDYGIFKDVPFGSDLIFSTGYADFAAEICEDLWTPVPPSSLAAPAGADIIVNLSASNELTGKHSYRTQLIAQQSGRCICGYVYSSAGFGESTTDVVFAGEAMISENGQILSKNERFTGKESMTIADIDIARLRSMRMKMNTYCNDSGKVFRRVRMEHTPVSANLIREVDARPFVPEGKKAGHRMEEIVNIQTTGLATRLSHIKAKTSVIGVSGGLDSTLAILITVLTYIKCGWDVKGIIGITMPGPGTTGRTRNNAIELMKLLGTSTREINIGAAVQQHFNDIGIDDSNRSVAYENTQARERTQILMDIANLTGGIVIGTGDLSEAALGWCTYNGDHMSMYNVNCSIPKTLVKSLVGWIAANKADIISAGRDAKAIADVLKDIIDTPISPELIPSGDKETIVQKTEDLIGPYELHDFFLYHMIRLGEEPRKILYLAEIAFKDVYDHATISKWLHTFMRRFMTQQFKRSSAPDGPKVGTVSLSQRGDWRMPSDPDAESWLE